MMGKKTLMAIIFKVYSTYPKEHATEPDKKEDEAKEATQPEVKEILAPISMYNDDLKILV